jgi:hypothetical protein
MHLDIYILIIMNIDLPKRSTIWNRRSSAYESHHAYGHYGIVNAYILWFIWVVYITIE